MKIRILILLALLCTLVQKTSGQGLAIDPTQSVSAADVEVTEVPTVWNGHSVRTALEIPIRALIACTVGGAGSSSTGAAVSRFGFAARRHIETAASACALSSEFPKKQLLVSPVKTVHWFIPFSSIPEGIALNRHPTKIHQ